jgi:AcrR family transcriptional regulator
VQTRKRPAAPAPRAANKKIEQRQTSMELLLDAALRLFVSQGYRSTNLEQIAGAARLTKGAVYFYFRSKEAVLIALFERVRRVVVDDAIAVALAAGPTSTDKLVAYIHYEANLGITHRDEVLLLLLMGLEFKERGGEAQDVVASLYKKQCSFIEKLIKAGQASGEFRADIRSKELASIVLATHDGTFLEWFRRSTTLKGPELVRALRSTILTGLVGRPPSSRTAVRKKPA